MKAAGILVLFLSSLSALAQASQQPTVQLDTLTKVMGILITIGGFFMAYMQMRMANKIAEVEARFNQAMSEMRLETMKAMSDLSAGIHKDMELIEKEIKIDMGKMATRHDIRGLQQVLVLQDENRNLKLSMMEKQLNDLKENR